jgi:hypothetical protein
MSSFSSLFRSVAGNPTNIGSGGIVANLPSLRTGGGAEGSNIDPTLRPYLGMGLQRAEQLFFGQQPQLYPEQMYVDPSQQTMDALARQEELARGSSEPLSAAQSAFLSGIQTPSLATPMFQDLYSQGGQQAGADVFGRAASGQMGVSPAQFQSLYGQAAPGVSSLYGDVARGGFQNLAMPGTAQTAAGAFLTGSPYQQALIDQSVRPIAQQLGEVTLPGIQSAFSQAGRYGSGAQQRAIGEAVERASRAAGDVATQIGFGTYGTERGFQEAARGQLAGLSQQDLLNRLGAVGTAEQTRQAQLAQQAGLAGQIAGLSQQDIATRMAGASGLADLQQAAFGRQAAAAGGIAGTEQIARQQQLAAAGMAPQFYSQQFLPSQQLGQIGAAREAIAAQPLQEEMSRFQFGQQVPYQQLQGFLSSVYGTPMTGSQIPATPQAQTNRFGQALGGGILGSQVGSMFGGIGGLSGSQTGAILGGLGGLLL